MRSRARLSAASASGSQRAAAEFDFGLADAQACHRDVGAIELLCIVDERLVAARHDIGNDLARDCFDIQRAFALGAEEFRKPLTEIRLGGV